MCDSKLSINGCNTQTLNLQSFPTNVDNDDDDDNDYDDDGGGYDDDDYNTTAIAIMTITRRHNSRFLKLLIVL